MGGYGTVIAAGITVGLLNRWLLLRSDYRHYPTYPHGQLIHLALGFIAASLGAVAVPAIAKPDFVAVTFLVLAAQQFREVRNMERETLTQLEETKLVSRGTDYIEGIARVFEARNYLVIMTALLCSGTVQQWGLKYVFVVGPLLILLSLKLMSGSYIGDIARVQEGRIHFKGSLLMVDDVVMMNVGLPQTRKKIMDEGMGVIIKPMDDNARLNLDAPGQRKAIIHDVVSILGSKVDVNETELMPMARKQVDQGYLAMFIVANEPDMEMLIEIIKKVPVLESARGTTLLSYYGRKAAD
jgi:hypothetical protein